MNVSGVDAQATGPGTVLMQDMEGGGEVEVVVVVVEEEDVGGHPLLAGPALGLEDVAEEADRKAGTGVVDLAGDAATVGVYQMTARRGNRNAAAVLLDQNPNLVAGLLIKNAKVDLGRRVPLPANPGPGLLVRSQYLNLLGGTARNLSPSLQKEIPNLHVEATKIQGPNLPAEATRNQSPNPLDETLSLQDRTPNRLARVAKNLLPSLLEEITQSQNLHAADALSPEVQTEAALAAQVNAMLGNPRICLTTRAMEKEKVEMMLAMANMILHAVLAETKYGNVLQA